MPMNRRTITGIAAALLILTGVVWIFQGIGVLGGSPMTGVSFWAWAGGASLLIGAYLAVRTVRGD